MKLLCLVKPWLIEQGNLPIPKPINIVLDPWQVPLLKYTKFKPNEPLRLGWFGNANNAFFRCDKLGELMDSITAASSIELVILSSKVALNSIKESFQASLPSAVRPWKLELVEWDDSIQPDQLVQVLSSVHVVWLPSNPSSPIKGGVSHNRLVDAVRSGSVVVGSSMQSYCELKKLSLLGSDHGCLINQLLPEFDRLTAKYDSIRSDILEEFSPSRNNLRWRQLLNQLLIASK